MYISDIVKARTLPSQFLAKQRTRSTPLRVGTDVLKMAESRTQTIAPQSLVFADSKAVAKKFGENAEINENFSSPSYSITKGNFSLSVSYEKDEETGRTFLMARIDDGSGKKIEPVEVTGDMRISRGSDGSFTILSGKDALTAGKLTGSNGDILIRVSGTDVKATSGDVSVINFGQAGKFDGGDAQMTYLGVYNKAKFLGGSGGNTFGESRQGDDVRLRSVFENSTIEAGDNKNTYDGYFVGSVVNGGEGEDFFSGIFTGGSVINGKGGDDSFTGFFKDSELNGGAGENAFTYVRGAYDNLFSEFDDASKQFFNVTIDGGESSSMHGVFTGTTINLGSGDHTIKGVFQNATVENEKANADISAFYAGSTKFIGEKGATKLRVHSADHVNIALGEGNNTVSLGAQAGKETQMFLGHTVDFSNMRFYGSEKELLSGPYGGIGYGSLDGTTVDVTKGTTALDINTGLEKSVNYYDANEADGTAKTEDIIPMQTEHNTDEKKNAHEQNKGQGPAASQGHPAGPQGRYEYLGEKKRRSEGIVPRTGLDDAVRVKTKFGLSRYFQEKNERLGHTKTISLYTSRYEWQI